MSFVMIMYIQKIVEKQNYGKQIQKKIVSLYT